MKNINSILLFVLASSICFAQNRNNIWCFGDSAGIDFNQSIPAPIITSLDTRGSCASIADSTGNLLFYANTRATLPGNTTRVWSKDNTLMQNGDSIIGRGWYNELLIVPMPDSSSKYYLFSVGATSIFGFYYSVIDMNLNGGLGSVVRKNVLVGSYKAWDMIEAIKHANGRDWWIITKDYESLSDQDSLHVYLVSPQGIQESIQRIGAQVSGNLGNTTFSKDGTKLLFTSFNGLIETMDFDRCTGIFSNANVIFNPSIGFRLIGSALSPNGNVAYYSIADATSLLIQLDLTASNVWASRDTIMSLTYPFETGGSLQLAPDDKIYWSCAWTNGVTFNYPYQDTMYHTENMNLSVINDPNVLGSGCNLSMYSFNLGGKRTYWGLPNNPDYDLGPVTGSLCDTLTSIAENAKENSIYIYPNPVTETAFVSNIKGEIIFVEAINSLGKITKMEFEIVNDESLKINTTNLSMGIYILKLQSKKGIFFAKFTKI